MTKDANLSKGSKAAAAELHAARQEARKAAERLNAATAAMEALATEDNSSSAPMSRDGSESSGRSTRSSSRIKAKQAPLGGASSASPVNSNITDRSRPRRRANKNGDSSASGQSSRGGSSSDHRKPQRKRDDKRHDSSTSEQSSRDSSSPDRRKPGPRAIYPHLSQCRAPTQKKPQGKPDAWKKSVDGRGVKNPHMRPVRRQDSHEDEEDEPPPVNVPDFPGDVPPNSEGEEDNNFGIQRQDKELEHDTDFHGVAGPHPNYSDSSDDDNQRQRWEAREPDFFANIDRQEQQMIFDSCRQASRANPNSQSGAGPSTGFPVPAPRESPASPERNVEPEEMDIHMQIQ